MDLLGSILLLCGFAGDVQNFDREMKKCLVEAFKKTDEEFLQKALEAKPTWKVCWYAPLPSCVLPWIFNLCVAMDFQFGCS